MISKDVWMKIEAIRSDHQSGAAEIAREAVEVFRAYLATTDRKGRCYRELRQLAESIADAQPTMAPVRNIANLCAEGLKASSWRGYPDLLDRVQRNLGAAKERVAEAVLPLIPTAAHLLTLSYSSNVASAILRAAADGRVGQITVLESRPGMEGRRLARDLVRGGLPCRLAVDALGPSLVGEADLVLVGADTLLRNGGVVNKIGSLGLALAAKAQQVPFVVASELTKLDPDSKASDIPVDVEREPKEVMDPPEVGIHVLNIYFEVVPPQYVGRIATDQGLFTPRTLARLASHPRGLWDAYLGNGGRG